MIDYYYFYCFIFNIIIIIIITCSNTISLGEYSIRNNNAIVNQKKNEFDNQNDCIDYDWNEESVACVIITDLIIIFIKTTLRTENVMSKGFMLLVIKVNAVHRGRGHVRSGKWIIHLFQSDDNEESCWMRKVMCTKWK